MDERDNSVIIWALLLALGGTALAGLVGLLNKKDKDHEKTFGPQPAQQGAPEYVPRPPAQKEYRRNPVVSLVIPAKYVELIDELRQQGEGDTELGEHLTDMLKDIAWGLWYGSAYESNFRQMETIAQETQPESSINLSLDFVICLFYLTRANKNLEAGTIGRRYDGIMELSEPSIVKRIVVSNPVSATRLSSVTLTRI
jgi:hypothetical protein